MSQPPRVATAVAASSVDEHLFFGRRVFATLAGEHSYASLLSLAIRGEPLSAADSALLADLTTICTVADARIWPMKACRLVASHGGLLGGLAAGLVALGSPLIGPWRAYPAAGAILVDLGLAVDKGADLREVVEKAAMAHSRLPGFGTPFRSADERLPPLARAVARHGAGERRYWRIFEALADAVRRLRGVEPNVASGAAAVVLDLGFDVDELGAVGLCNAFHMFLAHAREGAAQRAPVLRQLPRDSVVYRGPRRRASPRAKRAAEAARGAGE